MARIATSAAVVHQVLRVSICGCAARHVSLRAVLLAAAGSRRGVASGPGPDTVPPLPLSKPREPAMEECCGNDCRDCIWVAYWEELGRYEEAVRRQQEEQRRQTSDGVQPADTAPE
jgi:hypothetical protein